MKLGKKKKKNEGVTAKESKKKRGRKHIESEEQGVPLCFIVHTEKVGSLNGPELNQGEGEN